MEVRISAKEAMFRGVWDKVCDLKGINIWAVNEGLMDREELITLTQKEAETIGLLGRN